MFEISDAENTAFKGSAKIKVIGVGGGGCNAVNTMIRAGLSGVEYIVANTDNQALNANLATIKVQLGAEITKGLGAGANPEIGRKAALDEYEKLSEVLEGADMVFITAGMGGGTGTGAAPVIAKLAKELGALAVGVVTKPFMFEGRKRMRQAQNGIAVLEETVDSLITIPNQRLLAIAGENLSLIETFKKADEVLLNAVRGISDLINNTGHINADFADVTTVMANKGLALMGTGLCSGQDRAVKAAQEAISSPLLEDITIDGATGIIINVTGNESLTMHEVNEAVSIIMEAADDEAEIIFGTVIDESLNESVKVTVIATGLGGQERVKADTTVPSYEKKVPSVMIRSQEAVEIRSASPKKAEPHSIQLDLDAFIEEVPEKKIQSPTVKIETREESPLIKSIRDAALKYEEKKQYTRPEVQNSSEVPSGNLNREEMKSRTKTIAEKLGFINFDEDELDTPTFMRNSDTHPNQLNM